MRKRGWPPFVQRVPLAFGGTLYLLAITAVTQPVAALAEAAIIVLLDKLGDAKAPGTPASRSRFCC